MTPSIASRFVAGESPEAALNLAQSVNDAAIGVILNLLGEHYDDPELATADADSYIHLISEVEGRDLTACFCKTVPDWDRSLG